ncbi:MAG: hypothetical protein ACQER9_04835 [Nanobdellota archaeon]
MREFQNNRTDSIGIYPEFIALCDWFKGNIGIPDKVFYPFCGSDLSLKNVFDNVHYLDNNPEIIDILKRNGNQAYFDDIRNFNSDGYDLIIMKAPVLFRDDLKYITRHLKDGDYIIADDCNGPACWLFEQKNKYEMLAAIYNVDKDITEIPVTENIEEIINKFESKNIKSEHLRRIEQHRINNYQNHYLFHNI